MNNMILPRFKERGPEVAAAGSIGLATKATKERAEATRKISMKGTIRFLRWFKKLKPAQGQKPEHTYEYRP